MRVCVHVCVHVCVRVCVRACVRACVRLGLGVHAGTSHKVRDWYISLYR